MMTPFFPKSPDPFIKKEADMETAKFGHLNAIVANLNNIRWGIVTLVGGTATVPLSEITDDSLIFLGIKKKLGVNTGTVTWTIATTVNFTIDSSNGTDTHEISWLVILKP